MYSSPINVAVTTTIKSIAYKSGMSDSQVASATFTIGTPVVGGDWLIMIYLDAANNLEPYAIKDMNEMEYGYYQLSSTVRDKVKVIVLMDRMNGYDTSNGDWKDTRAFEITPDSNSLETGTIISTRIAIPAMGITSSGTSAEINMGDPNSLKNFVNFCKSTYTGYTNNALVLWNHGGGTRENNITTPTGAVCWDDDNNGDTLYTDELQQAISQYYDSANKLTFLGCDACLMGMVEFAYEFRNIVKYMSISPNVEGGDGWDYQLILNRMTSGMTGSAFAQLVVQTYRDSTVGMASETQTAVDLAYIEDLKNKVDALAVAMYSENNKTALESTRDATKNFSQNDYTNYPFYELGDFCARIISSTTYTTTLKTAATNAQNSLANAVIYAYAGSSMGSYYGTGATVKKGLAVTFPKSTTYSSVGKWYTSRNMSSTSTPYGLLDFCTFDNDLVVEGWKELFEAWYDSNNSGTGDTY